MLDMENVFSRLENRGWTEGKVRVCVLTNKTCQYICDDTDCRSCVVPLLFPDEARKILLSEPVEQKPEEEEKNLGRPRNGW